MIWYIGLVLKIILVVVIVKIISYHFQRKNKLKYEKKIKDEEDKLREFERQRNLEPFREIDRIVKQALSKK